MTDAYSEALFKAAEAAMRKARELNLSDNDIARYLVGLGRTDPYMLQLFYSAGYGKGQFEQRCGYPRDPDEISGDVAMMLRDIKAQRPSN